jgi:hypothetical protein
MWLARAKARNPLPSHGSLLRKLKRDRAIDLRGNMVSKKLDLIGVEKPWGVVSLAGDVTASGVSASVGQCLWTDDPLGVEPSEDGRFLAGWKTDRSGRDPIAP